MDDLPAGPPRTHEPTSPGSGDRTAYRDGFRDGLNEGGRLRDDAHDAKGRDGDDEKEGAKKDDAKKDDAKKDGDQKDGDQKKDGGKPLYKRPGVVAIAFVVVLAILIGAVIFWRHASHHETTDDAFVDGQTSQVAAQTAGRVAKLYVTDNQHVNAGDPLVDIDSRDDEARLAQARGQLATAQGQYEEAEAQVGVRRAAAAESDANARQSEADLQKAVQDLARYWTVDPDAVARQQVDVAVAAERSARARRDAARMSAAAARAQVGAALAQVRSGKAQADAARANVEAATLQRSYTHVVAPISGRVARRTVEPGNVISNGQALMALVGDSLWVTANYKETQLTRMKPGQPVDLVVDAFPDVTFRGHVDSVQRATGAYFSMLPAENATGNYVKVVQRVPVKIVFDDDRVKDYPIGPGMSVKPDVSLP